MQDGTSQLLSSRKSQAHWTETGGQDSEVGRRLKQVEAGQARLEESIRALAAKMETILSKV